MRGPQVKGNQTFTTKSFIHMPDKSVIQAMAGITDHLTCRPFQPFEYWITGSPLYSLRVLLENVNEHKPC